jgi:hypothetical protein
VQRRSYPASFGGNFKTGGFEHVLALDLAAHGARLRDESVALCGADPCPAGKRTLILAGNQLMLQIHESVGHATELDRVFGAEVDLAGASFATTEKLSAFRFGSPIVNLVTEYKLPDGLETDVRTRGVRLSSGERQLVGLARVALADPEVIVLDEATSNLDPQTESLVERALAAVDPPMIRSRTCR